MSVSRFRLRRRGSSTGSDNPQPPEERQPFSGEGVKIPGHALLERKRACYRLTLVGQGFAGFVIEVPHPVHRALQPRRINGKNDRSYDVGNFQAISRNARCQMEGFSLQDGFVKQGPVECAIDDEITRRFQRRRYGLFRKRVDDACG